MEKLLVRIFGKCRLYGHVFEVIELNSSGKTWASPGTAKCKFCDEYLNIGYPGYSRYLTLMTKVGDVVCRTKGWLK